MLTKSDLSQIRMVVQVVLKPLKKDVGSLKKDVKQVKSHLADIDEHLAKTLDTELVNHNRRIKRLETHTTHPPLVT